MSQQVTFQVSENLALKNNAVQIKADEQFTISDGALYIAGFKLLNGPVGVEYNVRISRWLMDRGVYIQGSYSDAETGQIHIMYGCRNGPVEVHFGDVLAEAIAFVACRPVLAPATVTSADGKEYGFVDGVFRLIEKPAEAAPTTPKKRPKARKPRR